MVKVIEKDVQDLIAVFTSLDFVGQTMVMAAAIEERRRMTIKQSHKAQQILQFRPTKIDSRKSQLYSVVGASMR